MPKSCSSDFERRHLARQHGLSQYQSSLADTHVSCDEECDCTNSTEFKTRSGQLARSHKQARLRTYCPTIGRMYSSANVRHRAILQYPAARGGLMKKLGRYQVLCLLLFIGFGAPPSHAATIFAKSGYAADLQTAINRAKTGDIVSVPSGRYSFNGTVHAPDGIYIRGAGRDKTFLIKSDNASSFHDHGLYQDGQAVQILRYHAPGQARCVAGFQSNKSHHQDHRRWLVHQGCGEKL